MTWTKPAWSGSPLMSTSTSVLLRKIASPSNSFAVSAHHAPCSGRSLLAMAASSDSKRATPMNLPSSVTPPVEPSQPAAPGDSSAFHRSNASTSAFGCEVLPWMTWTNMMSLPGQTSLLSSRLASRASQGNTYLEPEPAASRHHTEGVRMGPSKVDGPTHHTSGVLTRLGRYTHAFSRLLGGVSADLARDALADLRIDPVFQ